MNHTVSNFLYSLIFTLIIGVVFYAEPASAVIRCSPETSSVSGTFTGNLAAPTGLAVTAPLTTTRTFQIICNETDSTKNVAPFSSSVTVTILPPPPALVVSCFASPTQVNLNQPQTVTWTADVSGGTPPYTYLWFGDAPLGGSIPQTGRTASILYTSSGTKSGQVSVTDDGGQSKSQIPCSSSVTVLDPDFSFTAGASPTANLRFVGQTAASNPVTISSPAGFADPITLATQLPTSITIGETSYPVTYAFYDRGTKNLNSTLISGTSGIDMVITATKIIPSGNYPNTISIVGTSGTKTHTFEINLNVTSLLPVFEEF